MPNIAFQVVLESVRSEPPPHHIERLIVCSEKNSLGDLHEAIYRTMHFMEPHAFAFYFSDIPFGNLENEYGSPKDTVLNPAEYMFRTIHFKLVQQTLKKTDNATQNLPGPEPGQKKALEIGQEYLGSLLNIPDTEDFPDIKSAYTKPLESLQLKIGNTFFYIFDFGDLWVFTLAVIDYPGEVSLLNNQPFIAESIGDPIPQYKGMNEQVLASNQKYAIHNISRIRNLHKRIRQEKQIQKQQKTSQEPRKNKPRHELRFYRTFSPGSNILFINVKDTQKKKLFTLSFLIDLYKLGLKDFIIYNESARSMINKTKTNSSVEFEEISKSDAVNILARGLAIATEVGTPISPDCSKWLENLGIQKIALTGSLYKCFLCEEGELSEETVKKILEIAKRELQTGIAGTEEEEIIFFECDNCLAKQY